MSKRPILPVLVLVLVTAACGEPPMGEVDFGSGSQFVPKIADSTDDVGRGAALALDPDGMPFISYLGFPAELALGEIAVGRAVGAPSVPGVLVASESEGVWNRGAAAVAQDPPARVNVPFGPDTVESLVDATPEKTNGTDIAIGADGSVHVVWAAHDGIWAATGTESFTAELVLPQRPPLDQAGSLGWPSVAVAQDGTPWLAAALVTGSGHEVVAASPGEGGWEVQTVAEIAPCTGCPDPARAGIAVTQDGPVVVYADPEQGVMAARLDGSDWIVETVEAGADGTGISVTPGADGGVAAAYYAAPGSVSVATSDGDGWQTSEAVTVGEAPSSSGATDAEEASPEGRSTGIARTDDGTVYLAYVDPAVDAVLLASAAQGEGFEPLETRGTEAGRWPDVAATPDGATVSMTWYAPERQDLAYGSFQDVSGITVAAPSPPFAVSTEVGSGTAECGPDDAEVLADLEVVAPVGATGTGFEPTCLVAPAGEQLTLTFENADTGQLHNADFLTEVGGETLFTSGDPVTGPETQGPDDVDPQEEGSYYFQCDVHPDTMTGTLVVVKASKK